MKTNSVVQKASAHFSKHRAYDLALLSLISLSAISKWFNMGLPRGHDAVADMLSGRTLHNSLFLYHALPGWANDWFLGYPMFYVHPPLLSYLVMAASLPFGWVPGAKLLYLSFFVLSGVFAYLYVHELTKNRYASFAAGLAYVFLPYHIIDVGFEGHQGSFGMPYMLTPLALLCLERLIKEPRVKYLIISGGLLALLTLTFPQVFPLLVGPFLAAYVIIRICWERHKGRDYLKKATIMSLAAFCLSLLLTAFWWLPLISEIRYSYATSFPLEVASESSATFLEAITLRPASCCAPSSAYGSAGSAWLETLRMLPFILVSLGIILNRKNKYVWFFSGSTLVAILLAMGPDSPIDIFGFAHRHIPFFTGLRTPVRFLLFPSLAYAVLIGFCVYSITSHLGRVRLEKPRYHTLSLLLPVLICFVLVGNTWQETRTAFSTFVLPADQTSAFAWLKDRESGDYRLADLSFDPYAYLPQTGYTINPTFWTYLHGKETVFGGGTASAVKYAAAALESLGTDLARGPLDMSAWLNVFNAKYLLVDKTNPLSSNIIIGEDFEHVWTSETIDIYENHSVLARIYSFTEANERVVDLFTGDTVNLAYGEGTQEAMLSLSDEYHLHHDLSVKSLYHFAAIGDYLCLEADVEDVVFGPDDAIRLSFYSQYDLPDVHLSLGLYERDDSRYDVVIGSLDGITAGWHEVSFPLSLLNLRYSVDENAQLDPDQIDRLSIGVGKQSMADQPRSFELYFDKLSIVTRDTNSALTYSRVRPGQYQVHIDSDSTSYLVLSESYHPNWAAHFEGKRMASEMIYECLNSFRLDPGEYDVTLEFTTSPIRKAGNVISAITLLAFGGLAAFLVISTARRRGRHVPGPTNPSSHDA